MRRSCAVFILAVLACAGSTWARADEARIIADVREFFATTDRDRRSQLAREIEVDPAFARAKVTGWLHQAVPFDPLPSGQRTIQVPLGNGESRTVVLRIPANYDPAQPWPLIYALHGTGGSGGDMVSYFRHILGPAIDDYVIAAPTGYGDVTVDDVWPPLMEHPAVLAAVKHAVNVDSDRVFIGGYSRGGHASWTIAVLHADQFAGALPLAGTFTLPEVDKLWPVFVPNLANTPVLCAWGVNDTQDVTGVTSPHGGIAGVNRKLCKLMESLKLPVVGVEDPEKGHGGIVPPPEKLKELLAHRRPHYPHQVQHKFRHIYQAQAYWLEGHAWTGSQWTDKLPSVQLRNDENVNDPNDVTAAFVRMFRSLLGELGGTVEGQLIDVHRAKVKELTIWIGDDLIDWQQPVTVKVSGEKVFEGSLKPDLLVCLTQAARTYDFERLRWAGLRYRSGSKIKPVTAETEFPPPNQK